MEVVMAKENIVMANEQERRKHKRYRVKNGALALIDNIPGTIVDISKSGLAINYTVFGKEPVEQLRLDIFLSSDDFYLQDIPARLVSAKDRGGSQSTFGSIQVKRYSLQFGEMTEEQESNLKYFILHNTIAEG
jgi:c-di-GMP-binding flagellar brake protein YcgR